jgi:hypothetical protein
MTPPSKRLKVFKEKGFPHTMRNYIFVSLVAGILLLIMDGLMNANPYAQSLYAAYKPIAKSSLSLPVGIAIDLAYGFILAGIFLLLYKSLPGESRLVKGVSYAILVFFFRVVMSVASTWMMFNVPTETLLYSLVTGLCEMLVVGALYGATLKP